MLCNDLNSSNRFFCTVVIILAGIFVSQSSQTQEEVNLKGHLKPFGESGPKKEIDVRSEFPEPYDFLVNYVQHLKPLKLEGVIQNSRAVRQWTDDYLLSLDVPVDSVVNLETKKKENRNQETTEMHFHDFLRIYNQTEHYMVDDVPQYLMPDISVPCNLQCPELLKNGFAFAMMWFSSGGTKSVIHTDSFDNINCLLRGEKTFVMMDPARDREKIKMRTEGAYSDVDVDSVDLTQYPELAKAEFYHVHMHAGDCLYIPYLWIHQVRSFNSNIAVNFWWNHYATTKLLEQREGSLCQGQCDLDLTLDKVKLHKEDPMFEDYKSLRDWFGMFVMNSPFTETMAFHHLLSEFAKDDEIPPMAEKLIPKLFDKLDLDKDGEFTKEEHSQIDEETWKMVQTDMQLLMAMIEDQERDQREEYAQYVEEQRREEL